MPADSSSANRALLNPEPKIRPHAQSLKLTTPFHRPLLYGASNLVVGPVASQGINGTMTRLRDVVTGTNTLKGAADLAIVHVSDVVATHAKCMVDDAATGRYIVAPPDMVKIEDVFAALRELYPSLPVAALENQDIASGVPGAARKIESRIGTLGIELKPFKAALKDAVDSMIDHKIIAATA